MSITKQKQLVDETLDLLHVHILYQLWPEDLVWGLLDQMTFQNSSINSSLSPLPPCFCPALRHKCFAHFYFWLSIYPKGIYGMTCWWTTLTLFLPCSIYTHVCLCVYRYLGQGAYQPACLCMSACVHAFECLLMLRPSPHMRLSVEIIGRLSPQVQPWHCLGKNPNPVCRNATATF